MSDESPARLTSATAWRAFAGMLGLVLVIASGVALGIVLAVLVLR